MKKLYTLLLSVIVVVSAANAQNYSRIWTSLYTDSVAQQLHVNDVAVDSNGNSYLAGYKLFPNADYYQKHLFLSKVNAAGTQEWIRYYNGLFDSIDVAEAIALDKNGNIYVAGTRIDTFCNICTNPSKISDIIVMKYNAAGTRLWLNRYHDAIYKLAVPTDITLSPNGTIVVTGSDDTKGFVEKLNKNGKTIWTKKFDSLLTNTACFDDEENIIIAGAYDPMKLYQTQKPMTMKLKGNGAFLWRTVYDEPGKNGRLHSVFCDSLNNIYSNGQSDTLAFYNNPKIITIKYNNRGKQQWFRKEEDHSTTLPHFYGDFKIDASGNSYVTGFVSLSGVNDDWLITKYNSNGVQQWINHYDDSLHGSDKPIGLAIAKNKTVFVTGYSYAINGNYAITSVAYNNAGSMITKDIIKSGRNSSSFASGVGVDKNDNFYVSGEIGSFSNPYPSLITVKYGIKNLLAADKKTSPKIIGSLKLFPNPVHNDLNINFAALNAKNYMLTINNVNGNSVLSKQVNAAEKIISIKLDVSKLKTGVYTVNISDGMNTVSEKFIKE